MKVRRNTLPSVCYSILSHVGLVTCLGAGAICHQSYADDWGLCSIHPVGGPTMVPEPADGVITIGKPTGAAQKKRAIVSKDDGSKPACVYVKTDGFNPREKVMMETMIATKEMPVTIGVFVRTGEAPAPMKGTMDRRNRDFEYDGVSDNNVRFLVDELPPFVAKQYKLLFAFCGNKIWKRLIQQHAMGAWSPWTKIGATKL